MTLHTPISARTRATHIALLANEGRTSREIAAALGISHQRVCQIAERFGILLARPGSRRFGLYVGDRRARIIQDLAAEVGVSPATMIERMVRVVVDDGAEQARKRLGKLALPRETRR
jgi:hypothetical protein